MTTVYFPPSGGIAIPAGTPQSQVLPGGPIYSEGAGGGGGGMAGLDLDAATYEFGQRTGLAVESVSLFTTAEINVVVYDDDDLLLASPLFSYTETTDGTTGRLTRKEHASLDEDAWYFCVFRNEDGTLNGTRRLQATA